MFMNNYTLIYIIIKKGGFFFISLYIPTFPKNVGMWEFFRQTPRAIRDLRLPTLLKMWE